MTKAKLIALIAAIASTFLVHGYVVKADAPLDPSEFSHTPLKF